jgi:hypothetical protein
MLSAIHLLFCQEMPVAEIFVYNTLSIFYSGVMDVLIFPWQGLPSVALFFLLIKKPAARAPFSGTVR